MSFGSLEGITEVGNFVTDQVEAGLTGEELAESIRKYLNENFGIPAATIKAEGPPPVAQNFIPEKVLNQIQRRHPLRPTSTPGPGPSHRPASVDGTPGGAGPPAGVGTGGPPSGTPSPP